MPLASLSNSYVEGSSWLLDAYDQTVRNYLSY
jgi:hypothetical protein